MSTTAVRAPAEYESRLRDYYYERAEEGRAVRVGEKEVSEQAAIVARYDDLFSRAQLESLHEAENGAEGDDRERFSHELTLFYSCGKTQILTHEKQNPS